MKKDVFKFYTDATMRRTILKYMSMAFFALLAIRIFLIASFFSIPGTATNTITYVLTVFALIELVFVFPDLNYLIRGLWLVLIVVLTVLFFHHTQVKDYVCGTALFLVTLTLLSKIKIDKYSAMFVLGVFVIYAILIAIFVNRERADTSTLIWLNPNTSSYIFLCAGIALTAFASTFSSKGAKAWISIPFYLLAVGCLVLLVMFGGRASLIGAILFVGYFLLRKFFDKASKRTVGWLVFLLCIGSIAFAFFYSKVLYDWIGDGKLSIFGKDIFTGRQNVWSDAFEQIQGNWLFGIGHTLQSKYPTYPGGPTHLDNQMMAYLVCFGAVTFVLIVALLVLLVKDLCSSKKITIAVVLVLLVSAFFESFFFYQGTVSFTCIALFVCRYADQQKSSRRLLAGRKLAALQADGNKPLISVIVPVYNVEQYLRECVQSITSQSYQKLEIILVNDGSKDDSLAVCRALAEEDSRIKVIDKKNGGVSNARNAGLDAAKGSLIAFVDGDDYIEPDTYARMYLAMKEENADIVFCRFQKEYGSGVTVYYTEKNLKKITNKPWELKSLFYFDSLKEKDRIVTKNTHGSVCRSLFLKELINKEKLRFEQGLALQEDKLFLIRYLALCGKGAFVDHYLYHYRAEREGSAITVFTAEHKNYYQKRKECLEFFIKAIQNNTFLTEQEKEELIFLEKFEISFGFVVRTFKFEKAYEDAVKNCSEDEFLQGVFEQATVKRMIKQKMPIRRIFFVWLFKKQKYKLLHRLVKFAD